MKNAFDNYLWGMAESEIHRYLQSRKGFVLECIRKSRDSHAVPSDVDTESLCNVYEYYVSLLIKDRVRRNRFLDIMQLLDSELEQCDDPVLGTQIIWNMVAYNNQFLLWSKRAIEKKVEDNHHLIQESKQSLIENALRFSLANVDLRDQSVELGNYELGGIDFEKAKTLIYATIPLRMRIAYLSTMRDGIKLEFKKVTSPVEDPVYSFFTDLGLNISGVPLSFMSDVLQDPDNATLLTIAFDSFYHPDFEIVNSRIVNTDFAEAEAFLGRKYYPHKKEIVALLRDLYETRPDEFPFEIAKTDINIDLISNYFVNYIDERGKSFFHKVYTLTNPESFPKIKTRYLEKASRLNLGDILGVRDLQFESQIVSSSSLCNFVYRAFEIVVKKSIELRGVYQYLWEWDGGTMTKPLSEPRVQPLLKSHIQPILEQKGIQISREVIVANGSLDYLCSYTKDDKLLKVGIELKHAHHPELLHGLTKQLPAYLDDEGTQDGIFLVLWSRYAGFPYPSEFSTVDELRSYLEGHSPKQYRIRILVIDCTRKLPPSKL